MGDFSHPIAPSSLINPHGWRSGLRVIAYLGLALTLVTFKLAHAGTAIAANTTASISRAQDYSEQRLLEVFALMARGQSREALAKAQKRFAALAKVEERHANHYKARLAQATT